MSKTQFDESNYIEFFRKNIDQVNLKYQITHWIEKKKIVMPDWHVYSYDENGNIFYRFLLSENKSWNLVTFDEKTKKPNYYHDGFN